MKVTLTEMHSIQDAIRALHMSKRTWNPQFEQLLTGVVHDSVWHNGFPYALHRKYTNQNDNPSFAKFAALCDKVFKYGRKHTTLLRFIDISVIVEGLHRGATDDFDSHAKRLDNRIIRSSTRLATYDPEEMSNWYQGKIIPTDVMLAHLGIDTPEEIEYDGKTYVKAANGYILKGMENDNDVKRGLYMLSLPMTFTFKVNLAELAHIYRLRGSKEHGAVGTAAPELQEMIETLMDKVQSWYPQLTRGYFLDVEV